MTHLRALRVVYGVEVADPFAELGEALRVGTPYVEGAAVELEVVENFRGPKVLAFDKKRRKGYKRTVGHRQELTRATVKSI